MERAFSMALTQQIMGSGGFRAGALTCAHHFGDLFIFPHLAAVALAIFNPSRTAFPVPVQQGHSESFRALALLVERGEKGVTTVS